MLETTAERVVRIATIVLSSALFVVAWWSPAVYSSPGGGGCGSTPGSFYMFAGALYGPDVFLPWRANPLWLAAVIILAVRRSRTAVAARVRATAATALSTLAVAFSTSMFWPGGIAYTKLGMFAGRVAFYSWFGGLLILAVGSWTLVTGSVGRPRPR